MRMPILLGTDTEANEPVYLDPESFRTHYHLIGATGAGKTTAIHAMLRPLMRQSARNKACIFVLDRMGNLSRDLLLWMASNRCPEHARRRLLYLEPAREDVVLPFNPLHYGSEANLYYQVARAVDLILRAWSSQDVTLQPRLLQWSYKSLAAMSRLQYPIAMAQYLLHPGGDEHQAILGQLPADLRFEWLEVLKARGDSATRILESTRNRFDPFFKSKIMRRMFGVSENRFDVERLIRERRIVIVNLDRLGTLPTHLGGTIGALIANEVFETAYGMGRSAVDPTYVLMDEFQHFVGPDIEEALPTVRQMGLRLILAHQSFSQLETEGVDLTRMIGQARSRLMFANSFEDADIIAKELTTLTYDPRKVKDIRESLRQIVVGHEKVKLRSEGYTDTEADSYVNQRSYGYSQSSGDASRFMTGGDPGQITLTNNHSRGSNTGESSGRTRANSQSRSSTESESLVPIHRTFKEVSSVTYHSLDEQAIEWAKTIRSLSTGNCFLTTPEHPAPRQIQVDYRPLRETTRREAAVDELIQRNLEQDFFISAEQADILAEQDRQRLLKAPPIVIPADTHLSSDVSVEPNDSGADPQHAFRRRSRSL